MASTKLVWIPCCICNGTGYTPGLNRTHANGFTTWEPFDDECTNCMGDKGHRMRVLAPDPPPPPVIPKWLVQDVG